MHTSKRRIAIIGSRGYRYPHRILAYVRSLAGQDVEIVSGGAQGPDSTAVAEAKRLGIPYKVHPIKSWWKLNPLNGRRELDLGAGYERNALIIDDCDEVVAFWDGFSGGTQDAIRKAIVANKPVLIPGGSYDDKSAKEE
jgi:hypothetical protein